MREQHIPDLLATGCFQRAPIARSASGKLKMQYYASSLAEIDRYLEQHAPRLRADALSRFPDGITASRESWTILQEWLG
jgi:hypothetical protein